MNWRRALLLVVLLVVGVAAGAATRSWWLNSGGGLGFSLNISLPQFGLGSQPTPTPLPTITPTAFLPQTPDQLRRKQLTTLTEPFSLLAKPCFLATRYLCSKLVLAPASGSAKQISIVGRGVTEYFVGARHYAWGRILVHRGALFTFYRGANQNQAETQPYYLSLVHIFTAAEQHQLNPAFLYFLIDSIYQEAQRLNIYAGSSGEVVTLDVDRLAGDLQRWLIDSEALPSDNLAQQLAATGLSPQGQVLAYVLLTNVAPDVALSVMGEEGRITNGYYAVFGYPSDSTASDFTVKVGGGNLTAAEFYQEEAPAAFDFALCQDNKLFLCQGENTSFACRPTDFMAYVCGQYLHNLAN